MKLKHTQKRSANRSFRPVPFDPRDPWNRAHFSPKGRSKTQAKKLRDREVQQQRQKAVRNPKAA